jgi:hypothetical protein
MDKIKQPPYTFYGFYDVWIVLERYEDGHQVFSRKNNYQSAKKLYDIMKTTSVDEVHGKLTYLSIVAELDGMERS